MDPTQQTASAVDELRQIRLDARKTRSLDGLRRYFDRLQSIRRAHIDDFDIQVLAAEAHQEIIDRARTLRGGQVEPQEDPLPPEETGAAEIPPEVPKLDRKSWQRALGLALFFTVVVLAAFFYLIQTARRLNIDEQQAAAAKATQQTAAEKPKTEPVAATALTPTLRLYTDLIPGTVVLDTQPPRNLTDGELILDNLQPGAHSVRLNGRSGTAAFQFAVTGKAAPQITGQPSASDALVVLLSDRDGQGHLATNAEQASIVFDGKDAGEVGADGLALGPLGTNDRQFEVNRGRDRQRFVWTYTAAPALTVYVKSDPNAGTLVVTTGEDGVEVYIDNALYRRKTDHGQLRIPLKAGPYKIRVRKAGFLDPAPVSINIKKSEETPLQFKLQPAPEVPSTVLANQPAAPVTPAPTPAAASQTPAPETSVVAKETENPAPVPEIAEGTPTEGAQIRKGGGFVSYGVPKAAGSYSFQAHGRVGGFLKKGKLQWYAGYQDSENYILFSLDGKRANIREVRNGKPIEWNRVPFSADSNKWVDVSLSVKPDSVSARVKSEDGSWTDLGSVSSPGRDFTQDKVGVYIPSGDEVAVSNFHFARH